MRALPSGAHPPAGEWRELSSEPAARASQAWRSLVDLYLDVGRGGVVKVRDQVGRFAPVAALWPLSQVIAAALHASRVTGDTTLVAPLFDALERHRLRRGDGYLPFPGQGPLYYDDNAWVGLDQVQAALAGDRAAAISARRTLGVVAAGQAPGGGIRWRDAPGSPVNTCATAPTLQLALWLAGDAPPGSERDGLLAFAGGVDQGLTLGLRREDDLYADHVEPDGRVDHRIWAYNQGTPVGADVLWWRLTGDPARLDRATSTARASLHHFGRDRRLWGHPPVFVAVWLRNLLALHAARPVPGLLDLLDGYLDEVWDRARDPRTGVFGGGGIGRYDQGGVIDHAGLVQLFALRAGPEQRWSEIC